jgi:hypothetical protein
VGTDNPRPRTPEEQVRFAELLGRLGAATDIQERIQIARELDAINAETSYPSSSEVKFRWTYIGEEFPADPEVVTIDLRRN